MALGNAGHRHVQIGDFQVTALSDGILQASNEVLVGIDDDTANSLLRGGFKAVPPKIHVNAFLIRGGGRTVLVDAGTGAEMGDILGDIPKKLAAVGVAPDQIDTILMTHLHIDHAGGLTDAEGKARYPNAELVLHADELAFWSDDSLLTNAPDRFRAAIELARRTTAPYRDRMRPISGGEAIPDMTIEPLPGHTPGHSGYLIQSGGAALLIWGDAVHIPGVQFPRPDVGIGFDTDGAAAQASRKRIFAQAAADRLLVAGMHLEFPCFGHVTAEASGAYAFHPLIWEP